MAPRGHAPASRGGAVRTVGGYEILRTLGRGGMATVYLARQTDLDRRVALKELRSFDESEPQLARRFLREARLAGSLSHPNIVTVHDYFEHDGTAYIAMEYLPRGSLRPRVGDVSLAQVGGVLRGVLGGLAHAEQHRIVHRDLKPENLLVTADGWVKIADFGIAKAASTTRTEASLTTVGTTLGTPRYMAPERAMGQGVGPWSDLYSLGIIVFELLVGRTPFHDTEAPAAILMRQINDPVPPLTSLVPDVDPAIADWVQRLLVKDPAGRIRSAVDAWDQLEGLLIARFGARWLDRAGLAARPGGSARAPAPADPTPTFAATVAPATLPPEREPDPAPERPARRGLSRPVVLALLAAGLLGGVAAARIGGEPARPAAEQRPGAAGPAKAVPTRQAKRTERPAAQDDSGVGDSRSDDPSDDEPDEDDNGD